MDAGRDLGIDRARCRLFPRRHLSHCNLSWRSEQLAQNSIEAVIITLAVATLLKNRDRRIKRRFQEIGYLNHHIRNGWRLLRWRKTSRRRLKNVKN